VPADLPLSDAGEHELSFEDWFRAFSRFLDLLRTYQATLHAPWKSHLDLICRTPDSSSHWPTWLAYDISIRRQSIYDGIDPSIFHQSLWFHLDMESIKKSASRPGPCNPYDIQSRPHQTEWRSPHRCFRCGGPEVAPHSHKSMVSLWSYSSERTGDLLVTQMVIDTVSPSMDPLGAQKPIALKVSTGVPCAEGWNTVSNHALLSSFPPYTTSLWKGPFITVIFIISSRTYHIAFILVMIRGSQLPTLLTLLIISPH
jgi:hypothetical protein